MKILIMGLSGSGKSELAKELAKLLPNNIRLNADEIREKYNDWDFSIEGRIRQAKRINELANISDADYVIADFIAPTKESRIIFNADILIWVDTIKSSKYPNTDVIFENPTKYDFKIPKKNAVKYGRIIANYILKNKT
jgi:adenylylsulfate kinase